jgi:hypothetical protein
MAALAPAAAPALDWGSPVPRQLDEPPTPRPLLHVPPSHAVDLGTSPIVMGTPIQPPRLAVLSTPAEYARQQALEQAAASPRLTSPGGEAGARGEVSPEAVAADEAAWREAAVEDGEDGEAECAWLCSDGFGGLHGKPAVAVWRLLPWSNTPRPGSSAASSGSGSTPRVNRSLVSEFIPGPPAPSRTNGSLASEFSVGKSKAPLPEPRPSPPRSPLQPLLLGSLEPFASPLEFPHVARLPTRKLVADAQAVGMDLDAAEYAADQAAE